MNAFSRSELLFALAALPVLTVLAVLAARRRRRGLLVMAGLVGAAVLERQRPSRLRGLCLGLGLTLLVVGMAGPRWGRDWSQSAAPGRDVVVVVDLSRSMFCEAPTRSRQVKAALRDLSDSLRLRGGHRVALVVFAGVPRVACPLTHDLDHFRDAIESLDDAAPDPTLGAGTRLGSALLLAVQTLEGRSSRASDIILLSDGDDPARDGEYWRGIEAAKADGVPVLCVGVGDSGEPGHPIPGIKGELSRRQEAPLAEIARNTKGRLLLKDQPTLSLGDHYREHARASLEEDSPDRVPVYRQRQAWFLLPAFVFLSLTLLLPERRGVP